MLPAQKVGTHHKCECNQPSLPCARTPPATWLSPKDIFAVGTTCGAGTETDPGKVPISPLPSVDLAAEVLQSALHKLVLEECPVSANASVLGAASPVACFEFGAAIPAKGNMLGYVVVAELAQECKAGPSASCIRSHPLSVRIRNSRFRDSFFLAVGQVFFPARFS